MSPQLQATALLEHHRQSGAKTVDFGGWEMPVHYGSQIDEHHAVRQDAGMFDVSHMTIVDLHGARTRDFLRHLLANDVAKLQTAGKALYSCMLNERGGVIDDLITYFMREDFFRVVVNAATRDKDLPWIERHAADFDVKVNERRELAMIAVQGPNARAKAHTVLDQQLRDSAEQLKPFNAVAVDDQFVARTGYTGEDGYEIVTPEARVGELWDALLGANVRPCGLGARDTLRLEAGMHLYGQDMNEDTTPLATGLAWTVALDDDSRAFIGRDALLEERSAGVKQKLVGLLLEGRGVLRSHQSVVTESGALGEVTSGTFSPTLKRSIAMAHVPIASGENCAVDIRGKQVPASVHALPFVRHGEIKISV